MSEHKRTSEQHLVQTVRATELSLRHYMATPELRSRGHKLARDVWKQHGEQLVGFLDRKMRRLQLATLRALAALASASTAIARELLQRIDSLEGLKHLITSCERAHGPAANEETSAAVVEFVLALFGAADRAMLVRMLSLEHKRLATLPMRLLPQLDGEAQARALSVLRRCVLDEPTLPNNSKQRICDHGALHHLTLLYSGDAAHLVHAFLSRLCTVLTAPDRAPRWAAQQLAAPSADGEGAYAGSSAAGHAALRQLLLALQPVAELRQQRLLLTVLRAVPPLWADYVRAKGASSLLEPKAARGWLGSVAFACRLLAAAPAEGSSGSRGGGGGGGSGGGGEGSTAQLPVAVALLLPPAEQRSFWSKALLHAKAVVRVTALHWLLALLLKLDAAEAERGAHHPTQRGAEAAARRRAAVAPELRRRLPDVQVLVSMRQHLSGDGRLEQLMVGRLLHALHLYRRWLPQALLEARVSPAKLLGCPLAAAPPHARYYALCCLRDFGVAADPRGDARVGGSGGSGSGGGRGGRDGGGGGGGGGAVALQCSADELTALLALGAAPQPPLMRNLLHEVLLSHLRGCGVLSRADAEAAAWLSPLAASTDAAAALGSLLQATAAKLHAFVDASMRLGAPEPAASAAAASAAAASAAAAAAGDADADPKATRTLTTLPASLRGGSAAAVASAHSPSPLALCAVARLAQELRSSETTAAGAVAYGCAALGAVARLPGRAPLLLRALREAALPTSAADEGSEVLACHRKTYGRLLARLGAADAGGGAADAASAVIANAADAHTANGDGAAAEETTARGVHKLAKRGREAPATLRAGAVDGRAVAWPALLSALEPTPPSDGDAQPLGSAAWLALRMPAEAALAPRAALGSWLARTPTQALLHAALPRARAADTAAVLLGSIEATLSSDDAPDASSEAAMGLLGCFRLLGQLTAAPPAESRDGDEADWFEAVLSSAALAPTALLRAAATEGDGGATARLVLWQLGRWLQRIAATPGRSVAARAAAASHQLDVLLAAAEEAAGRAADASAAGSTPPAWLLLLLHQWPAELRLRLLRPLLRSALPEDGRWEPACSAGRRRAARLAALQDLMVELMRLPAAEGESEATPTSGAAAAAGALGSALGGDGDGGAAWALLREPLVRRAVGLRLEQLHEEAARASTEAEARPSAGLVASTALWLRAQLASGACDGAAVAAVRAHALLPLARRVVTDAPTTPSAERWPCAELLRGLLSAGPPLPRDTRDAALAALQPPDAGEEGWAATDGSAALATCALVVRIDRDDADADAEVARDVERRLVPLLRACLRQQPAKADAAAVWGEVEAMLRTAGADAALAEASLELLQEVRGFVAAAQGAPAARLGRALLRGPCGPQLAPLLPELHRQTLVATPARLRPVAATGGGRRDWSDARAHLELLLALSQLICCKVSDAEREVLFELVQACATLPAPLAKAVGAIVACHVEQGLEVLPWERAQVATHAQRVMELGGGRVPLPSLQTLATLGWLPRDQLRRLTESFPLDMLDPRPAADDEPSSAAAAPRLTDAAAPSGGLEHLGCYLALHALLHHGAVDARAWLEHGGASFVVMGLAAEAVTQRRLGYACLAQLLAALEQGPSFRERPQAARLLHALRDAITEQDQRLPCVHACFVAQGLAIVVRPTHEQYKQLNGFLLAQPYLQLDQLPLFFSHFHSGAPSYRDDRLWLLSLLQQGLRTDLDEPLLEGRHVLQLILSLHDSHLADPATRRAALLVLLRAAERPALAEQLLRRHAVLGWARLQLGRRMTLEAMLGLAMLLARLAAAPGFGELRGAPIAPLGPLLEGLWQAFERLEAAAATTRGGAAATRQAEADGDDDEAEAGGGDAMAVDEAEADVEGGGGGGGGGGAAAAEELSGALRLFVHCYARALRAALCGAGAGAGAADACETLSPRTPLAVLRRVQALGEAGGGGGGGGTARRRARLDVTVALGCWPLRPCGFGDEGVSDAMQLMRAALEPLLLAPPPAAFTTAALAANTTAVAEEAHALTCVLAWARGCVERSAAFRRAVAHNDAVGKWLLPAYAHAHDAAAAASLRRLCGDASSSGAAHARTTTRELNRLLLLLLAQRAARPGAAAVPGAEERGRQMRELVPALLARAEAGGGAAAKAEELLALFCRESWHGGGPAVQLAAVMELE